jgi:hypothetical protein
MGLLDRLFGRRRPAYDDEDGRGYAQDAPPPPPQGRSDDERAIERYRYLLATAPPEAVEQAHAEAFGRLTPEQRRQVLQQLAQQVPAAERQGDDPASLARMATRAEMRRPGTLERTFGGAPAGGGAGYGGGPSFGAMVGSSLLGTVAGVVVGSAIANALFGPAFGDLGSDQFAESGDAGAAGDEGADGGDAGADDAGGGDYGGDYGGGDFGGGDFGGGDFGDI